jgi:hypothetical protein
MKHMKKTKGASDKGQAPQRVNLAPSTQLIRSSGYPPDRNFASITRLTRRFVQNGSITNQAFTLANGHDQFLVVTNVTGAAVSFVDAWRIRRISIWAISQGQSATSMTLTPTGADVSSNNFNDREAIYHCSSRSTAEPACMIIKPSPLAPMGSWHFTNNINAGGALFQVLVNVNGASTNTGVTMDIEFEVGYNWVGSPLGYTVITATTLPGIIGGRNILGGFSLLGINNLG